MAELGPGGRTHKQISAQEFREAGFLQEANRLFFHPRGLALSVMVGDDGRTTAFGEVWDYRDDPEGLVYAEEDLDGAKADAVDEELRRHVEAREALLGHTIQPIPPTPEDAA